MNSKILSVSGIPYGPDIVKLDEAFPHPEEGKIITHEDLQRATGIEPKTQRYYGVINSWRRKLLNSRNIDTQWVPTEGLEILTPAKRIPVVERDIRIGNRKTRRAIRRHMFVPRERLDDIGKQRFDHNSQVFAKLKAASDECRKELPVDLYPVKSLPKPKLVNKAS